MSLKAALKQAISGISRVSTLRFAVVFVALAVLISVMIVLSIDLLWDGRLNAELEVAGVITPLLDALLLVFLFTAVFDELRDEVEMRKRVEEELRRIHQFRDKVMENATDAIYAFDVEGRFTLANRRTCEISGYSLKELIGSSYEILFDEAELPAIREQFRSCATGGQSVSQFEAQVIRKDRVTVSIAFSIAPIYDGEGITGVLGTGEDITARKQRENQIRESEEELRTITHTARDAIIMIDNDGKISFWNPAAEKIFNYRSSEVIGRNLHTLIGPQRYHEAYRRGFSAFRKTGTGPAVGKTLELEAVAKGGREFPVELSLSAIQVRDEWHAVGIIRDISERKRRDEEIRGLNAELEVKVRERTQQLLETQEELVRKEKLSILGQLSGSVGHELRNPLGVISNAIYYLRTIMPDADEGIKEYFSIIKNEIDNSQRIISDLLDFSRVKTPQTAIVSVGELVAKSLEKCAIPDSIGVTKECPQDLPNLTVDPFQMGQVLQNLIMNAVQAMQDGGTLRIGAKRAYGSSLVAPGERKSPYSNEPSAMSYEPDEDFVEISVSDTGEGISPENMKKLFQPLFTTKAKGIGLGLVVCKKLTEANGGTIRAGSEFGTGTTFTLSLPAAEPDVAK
jgi:PAS domain S-box-containing protein